MGLTCWVLGLWLLAGAGTLLAQATPAPAPTAESTNYVASFDPAAFTKPGGNPQLPANFAGCDPERLFSQLNVKKDEFETTDQYNARRQKSLAELPPRCAFWLSGIARGVVASKYNADKQEWEFTMFLEHDSNGNILDSSLIVFSIANPVRLKSDEYDASNAMGAKIHVTRSESRQIGIHPPSVKPEKGRIDLGAFYKITAKMPADEARQIDKKALRMLVVCQIDAATKAEETRTHSEPTFQSPSEFTVHWKIIRAPITDLWLVNRKTGEVVLTDHFKN